MRDPRRDKTLNPMKTPNIAVTANVTYLIYTFPELIEPPNEESESSKVPVKS